MKGKYSPKNTGIYNETVLIDKSRTRYGVRLKTNVWINDKGYLDGEVTGYTITNLGSKNVKEVEPELIIEKIRDGKLTIANDETEKYEIYRQGTGMDKHAQEDSKPLAMG
tara:strand:- start:12 stop:341 length:330 start_codon:yes stop_codon:yes gene_type:complete